MVFIAFKFLFVVPLFTSNQCLVFRWGVVTLEEERQRCIFKCNQGPFPNLGLGSVISFGAVHILSGAYQHQTAPGAY